MGDPRLLYGMGDPRRLYGMGDPRRLYGMGDPRVTKKVIYYNVWLSETGWCVSYEFRDWIEKMLENFYLK